MMPRSREEIFAIQKRRTERLVGEDSPVPLEARRRGFAGLEFFPVSERYQFGLKLQKYDVPGLVKVSLSSGEVVEVLRVGFLEFSLDGQVLRLQVYKKRPDDVEVFVPLRDGTSGAETYGAGRYVDVEVGEDDSCVLDFNLAYNPLCAFDPGKFVCPYPPVENWLMNVKVAAGEKMYRG